MNPIIPGLSKSKDKIMKMSSSEHNTKIDILDSADIIKKKVNRCYCLLGDVKNNTPLIILEKLIFPILERLNIKFVINRPKNYGGTIEYESFNILKDDFENESLHPADLKKGLIESIDLILDPVRSIFKSDELQTILKIAYPNE